MVVDEVVRQHQTLAPRQPREVRRELPDHPVSGAGDTSAVGVVPASVIIPHVVNQDNQTNCLTFHYYNFKRPLI